MMYTVYMYMYMCISGNMRIDWFSSKDQRELEVLLH